MKKLLLLWLLSGSLDGFSQTTTVSKGATSVISDSIAWLILINRIDPDTIRATLIVYHDGEASIVHTKAGFVVVQYGKEDVFLDDRQRVIKYPMEVLTYKIRRASK